MSNKAEKRLKSILYILVLIYVITLVIGFYLNYQNHDTNALGMVFVACLTPLIVPLLFRFLHLKPVYEIYICNILFVYFASLIGSGFHGYSQPYFDKVVHFFSGLIFTIVSMLIFMMIKKVSRIKDRNDYHLFLIFMNTANLAIAVCWEFYEYAMLIFFNNDCINHYTQGVHDSITDMLCAFVGGLIITALTAYAYQHNKNNFITNLCEKSYRLNIEKSSK